MLGSSPARITNMIRYSSGIRGQTANLLVAGSNPARISKRRLRLMDRTPASQAGNAGSIPAGVTKNGIVAQLVERQTENLGVAGSSPADSTTMWI